MKPAPTTTSPIATPLYHSPVRYDPFRHKRRSIRLRGYDYSSPGAYFITICAHGHESLFGTVTDGRLILNGYGKIVRECWYDLPRHYPHVTIDAFVVMPNHVHGVIVLLAEAIGAVGAGLKPAPTTTERRRQALPEVVRGFKTFSARRINTLRDAAGTSVWQRNYYEHIVRDDKDLERIRIYIADNPRHWEEDECHP